jgi:putative flippase GtrA
MSSLQAVAAALRDPSALRYLAVGVGNTIVGLSVIYLGMYALGLGNAPANVLGYAIGILVSFVMNRRWTFKHDGATFPAFARFIGVLCVAYVVNLVTVLVLADGFGMDRYLAQAAGIPPYTLIGYLGSRWFAFKRA